MRGIIFYKWKGDEKMFEFDPKVKSAIEEGKPVLALESTVLVQGLPYPYNMQLFDEIEKILEEEGTVGATIGIINGVVKVGMSRTEVEKIIEEGALKIGTREIPYAIAMKKNAATTVSATMRLAHLAGISVFSTGGIGGVHVGDWDVSQDITELSQTPIIVVSAGCKSILDVKKTIEFLETFQITLLGYKTDRFPIFFEGLSDYKIEHVVDSPEQIAQIFKVKENLGIFSGILVANPIPEQYVLSLEEVEEATQKALGEAQEKGISAKEVTPFLLSRIAELTNYKTVHSNLELLKNNVRLGCQITKSV